MASNQLGPNRSRSGYSGPLEGVGQQAEGGAPGTPTATQEGCCLHTACLACM